MQSREYTFNTDEGPRRGTTAEGLSKLRPAFAQDGFSTAGNSSQMSDGAGFVLVVSEKVLKEHNLTPIARLVDYQVAGASVALGAHAERTRVNTKSTNRILLIFIFFSFSNSFINIRNQVAELLSCY